MNIVPAGELKRRGVVALTEALKNGPVHIIQRNRPVCVVIREDDFVKALESPEAPGLREWVETLPEGSTGKQAADRRIRQERESWGK